MSVQPPPDDLWSTVDPTRPMALLPVRIEVRFGQRAGDGGPVDVLRVRIFPDDICVPPGEPRLGPTELSAGREYWESRANDARAWEVLCRRVGADRAVWVARATRDGGEDLAGAAEDRPQVAHLMPDSWVIVGEVDGAPVFTHYVARRPGEVQVGLGRDIAAMGKGGPDLFGVDDGLRWLTDFTAALELGMAAEVDLVDAAAAAVNGLSALYVIGVRDGEDPLAQADDLNRVLQGHAARDRVGFLAQGTPTNTLTDRPAGWSSARPVYAAERRVDPAAAQSRSETDVRALQGGADDSSIFESALGLEPGSTLAFDAAAGAEQELARQMALALFPVTIGEVVSTLGRPAWGVSEIPQDVKDTFARQLTRVLPFARNHVACYVRGRGTLPTLRLGRQPYGVLPILPSLDACPGCGQGRNQCLTEPCCPHCLHWRRLDEEPEPLEDLVDLLAVLRPFWERAADGVPTLRRTPDVEAALTRLLCQAPVPHPGGYEIRDVVGPLAQKIKTASKQIVDLDPSAASTASIALHHHQVRTLLSALSDLVVGTQLEELSIEGTTRLGRAVAATNERRTGWESPGTYLARLCRERSLARYLDAGADDDDQNRPKDLLYVLAEYALELAGENDIFALMSKVAPERFVKASAVRREIMSSRLSSAVSDVLPMFTTPIGQQREVDLARLPVEAQGLTAGEILERSELRGPVLDLVGLTPAEVNGYAGTKAAVQRLANAGTGAGPGPALTDADFTRLTGETLACAATRLDAWATSIAAQRLDVLRLRSPRGVTLGVWGVLVDVVPQTRVPAELDAAALSTWREYVSAGQPGRPDVPAEVSAPLDQVGYVHAPSLGQAVTAAVLRAGELAHRGDGSTLASLDLTSARVRTAREVLQALENGQPLGAVLGYRVERMLRERGLHGQVDALRRKYPQRRYAGAVGEPAAGSDAVVPPEVVDGFDVWQGHPAEVPPEVFEALDRTVQAVADLLVAEGLHQITSGRPDAAGGTLAAVSEGGPPPPAAVVDEPRSGVSITHRLLVAVGDTDGTEGWDRETPRAALAPEAERWAESVLGPATSWTLTVNGQRVPLATLGIGALDVLSECHTSGAAATGARSPSGIARAADGVGFDDRLLGAIARAGHAVDIEGAQTIADDPVRTQLYAVAEAAHDVLAQARALSPADVRPEGESAPPEPASYTAVAERIVAHLLLLESAMAGVQSAATDPDAEATMDSAALAAFERLGIPGSVATASSVPAEVAAAAYSAGLQVLRDVDQILDDVGLAAGEARRDELVRSLAATDGGPGALVRLARCLGGDAALPLVPVDSPLATHRVVASPAPDPQRWITRMSRIRPAVATYDDLALLREARGDTVDAVAFQVPWVEAEGWLGGTLPRREVPPAGNPERAFVRPPGPRTHLVGCGTPAALVADPLTGFVVDDVAEVLPGDTVVTGVGVHVDAPSARPPQVVLLAVHPNPQAPWTWRLAYECAKESVALARLRGVDLDDLAPWGLDEYLPLTYLGERPGATPLSALTPVTPDWTREATKANRVYVAVKP